jgi:hypothetical protein
MKRTIMFGIIIVSISMVSYVTAIPYAESQPFAEKINKLENIRNTIDSITLVSLIGLICMMIGSLLLIQHMFFYLLDWRFCLRLCQ